MHCRKQPNKKTDFKFRFGDYDVETVGSYRYLGLDINETLNYTHGVKILHDAGGRALGALTAKYYASKSYSF